MKLLLIQLIRYDIELLILITYDLPILILLKRNQIKTYHTVSILECVLGLSWFESNGSCTCSISTYQ